MTFIVSNGEAEISRFFLAQLGIYFVEKISWLTINFHVLNVLDTVNVLDTG